MLSPLENFNKFIILPKSQFEMHIVGQERHVLFQFRHVPSMFVGTSTAPLKIHAHALVDFALGSCFKTPFDSEIIALMYLRQHGNMVYGGRDDPL
jgi:hypothetical protein